MSRAPARQRHGAAVLAPDEAFSPAESPLPGPVRAEPSSHGPAAPLARLAAALRVVGGIVLVLGAAVAVAFSAHRYALTSPRFAVEKLEVSGGKRFGGEELRKLGGVGAEANLFALKTEEVERRLLENPWIAEARVTRRLPSTLSIKLTEREAKAQALLDDQLYLVSERGEPFKRVEPDDPHDLPVVTGVSAEALARDRRRALERLEQALSLAETYQRLGMSRVYPLEEVHLEEGGAVALVAGKEAIRIALGKGNFRQRLAMAERVVLEARRAGRLPAVVFADNEAHPERVVVRMR